jgi:hypothetical protein
VGRQKFKTQDIFSEDPALFLQQLLDHVPLIGTASPTNSGYSSAALQGSVQ